MSVTLTISGRSSVLSCNYFPPIELKPYKKYVLGLILFETYNSIPNIDETSNLFHYADKGDFIPTETKGGSKRKEQIKVMSIPEGSYELENIATFLQNKMKDSYIKLRANNSTLKSEIKCSKWIYFDQPSSVGSILGFKSSRLTPDKWHESDLPVNILKVESISIECNITSGSYTNERLSHTIHEFCPAVPPGYQILETPANIIYLPIGENVIENITLRITDQHGRLVNFRGEHIIVRLHIKPEDE